jgi:hypothetical protein
VVQRAAVEVAVDVEVEVNVDEQNVPAAVQLPPLQQGPLAAPQVVHTPGLVLGDVVSHRSLAAMHLMVGEVLLEVQQA